MTLWQIVKAGGRIHSGGALTASSFVFHRLFSAMCWWACGMFFMIGTGLAETARDETAAPTVIRVTGYTPWAWSPPTRARRSALQTFMNETVDPKTGQPWGRVIRIEPDNPLSFPGFSLKILNFSAGTGEEVVTTNQGITQFYQYRDQRFLMPLNAFIWRVREDDRGRPRRLENGEWDYITGPDGSKELIWPSWNSIPRVYREMMTWKGDVFGVPTAIFANGLMFRRDAFRAAGLDPARAPGNWEEFFDFALAISASAEGIFGVQLTDAVADAHLLGLGGSLANKETDSKGRERWVSTVDSEAMVQTVAFLRRLTLTKWIVAPDGKPFVVWSPDSPETRQVVHPSLGAGRWSAPPFAPGAVLEFAEKSYGAAEIRTGVAFNQIGGQATGTNVKWYDLFTQDPARIGMAFVTPERYGEFSANFDHELLGFAPVPAGPAGAGVFAQGEIAGLNYILAENPAKARLAWAVLSFLASDDYHLRMVQSYVREGEGIAETLNPQLLEKAGFSTVAERIPEGLRDYWKNLDSMLRPVVPAKNFQAITTQYLGPIYRAATTDPAFDCRAALTGAREQIQARLDFASGDYSRVQNRTLVVAAMLAIIAAVLVATLFAIRMMLMKAADEKSVQTLAPGKASQSTGWVLLAPSLLLISVFSYYPIFKALPIAFQDYSVTGGGAWVGSANFVEVFTNPAAWTAMLKTAYYMVLSVGVGFFAPVVLAILMSEIRSFRYFLRTVYYLPAVVAGIVMLLLWQRFYEPTPDGMVNNLYLSVLGAWNALVPAAWEAALKPVDWLRDPVWGIPCVVFVGIWGGMGPGMLIYLAALKSIPEDLYEAAEIDGATWRDRLYHITLSYLRPLLVINLIGAVIGAFQASGNILALSGNFPATYTFAVHLWFETFGLGNFGVGTALSWVMAAILMGFTLWQLRILRSVEFRRAKVD